MRRSLLRIWGAVGIILSTIGSQSFAGTNMKPEEFFSQPELVALAQAAGDGEIQEIRRLAAQKVDINAQGLKGMNALMWSLYRQNRQSFTALLEHGADPNLHLDNGDSVISIAAIGSDVFFLKKALEHGGDPNLGNPRNRLYPTPLFRAAEQGKLNNVKVLVEAGTDISRQDVSGDDAATLSAGMNQWHVTLYLLKAGAPLVDNASSILFSLRRHNIGYVPGNEVYEARLEVARLLRERGLSVEVKKPAGAPADYDPNELIH